MFLNYDPPEGHCELKDVTLRPYNLSFAAEKAGFHALAPPFIVGAFDHHELKQRVFAKVSSDSHSAKAADTGAV